MSGRPDDPIKLVVERYEVVHLLDRRECHLAGYIENVSDPHLAQVRIQLPECEIGNAVISVPDPSAVDERFKWRASIEIPPKISGPISVTVLASMQRDSDTARFHLDVPRPTPIHNIVAGAIDEPLQGSHITGDVLALRGWCLFPDSHVARIEVIVDGKNMGLARPYVERNLEGSPHKDALLCGFEETIHIRRSESGPTSLVSVEATSLDGRRWRSDTREVTWIDHPSDADEWAKVAMLTAHNTEVVQRVSSDGSRVIVFAHGLEYAGAQLWLLEMLNQFSHSPELDYVVISPTDGPLRAVLASRGVTVHITSPCRLLDPYSYEGHVQELSLLIKALNGGAVLVNTLVMFPAVEAAHRLGVPSLWAIHESIEPAVYMHQVGRPTRVHIEVLERFHASFQYPRALIFEAQATSDLFSDLRADKPRFVVDYGVDIDEIDVYRSSVDRSSLRSKEGFTGTDTLVLVVGTEPRKALSLIEAAFDELSVVHDNLHLVFVGSYGSSYFIALAEQIKRSRHSDRVHLVPLTSDVFPWYEMSDLLLCASDLESLPRSIIEAMAFELPIVSTDVFGISELIEDGRTGWLTRSRDLEGLLGLLHFVLEEPRDVWRHVAKEARMEAVVRHGDQGYGRRFGAALLELLRDPEAQLDNILSETVRN